MKKIIILSDTHMPKKGTVLPPTLQKELENGVDLIIHAGDIQTHLIYDMLCEYAPVYAVYGNVDEDLLKNKLPLSTCIEIEGVRIGITHGHGTKKTTEKRAIEQFDITDLDMIIYGHSHIPVNKRLNHLTLFNPGSATDKRRQKEFSFGRMIIDSNTFTIEHIFYSSKV